MTSGAFLSPVSADGPMKPSLSFCLSAASRAALQRLSCNKSCTTFSSLRVLSPFGGGIIYFLLTTASLRCILTATPRRWSRHKFFHTLGRRLRSLWRPGRLGQRLLTQALLRRPQPVALFIFRSYLMKRDCVTVETCRSFPTADPERGCKTCGHQRKCVSGLEPEGTPSKSPVLDWFPIWAPNVSAEYAITVAVWLIFSVCLIFNVLGNQGMECF